MTENDAPPPLVWIVDSQRSPLAGCGPALAPWATVEYFPHDHPPGDWTAPPDVIFFSAEIPGGAGGEPFALLTDAANGIPLIAVARLRSLAQAVAFFRAGAADYLSLPLEEEDARARAAAAMERAAALAMRGMVVELEPIDPDPGEISLRLRPSTTPAVPPAGDDEDILAELRPAQSAPPGEDEPVAVDGLPIPTLWEELPCGVVVFDSNANLVFSNTLAMDLFGFASLADLQDALENSLAGFNAHAANHKPLADNQWPHILSAKTRTPRSAVVSVEKPDRRRSWLRIDCLPHLHGGQLNRLSMTLVNLTGELPPLVSPEPTAAAPARDKPHKAKRRGKRK
jgi:CheY-like chemotaxis protein